MKEIPIIFSTEMVKAILDNRKFMTRRVIKPQPLWVAEPYVPFKTPDADPKGIIKCPYGQPGDRLWVRETWCNEWKDPDGWTDGFLYRADGVEVADVDGGLGKSPWRPSIHMPKIAARIWLEVVSVRVERLQDINVDDVIREGLEADNNILNPDPSTHESIKNWNLAWAQHVFRELWDKLNAKRGYGWDTNPWLWVVEFRRVQP